MAKGKEDRQARAAAARQASASAEARERRIRWIGTGAVVVIVAGIIGVGVMGSRSDEAPSDQGTLPAAVNQTDGSYTLNPDTTATGTLELWEDFQCPGCRDFEEIYAVTIEKLAARNIVKVVWHPGAFLDPALKTEYSSTAISAWGCAIDLGPEIAKNFHRLLYANQNAVEGGGWTDQQYFDIGTSAGVTKAQASSFRKCVTNRSYMKWASVGTKAFSDAGIQSTPTVWLNGKEVPKEELQAGPTAFYKWVKANASK